MDMTNFLSISRLGLLMQMELRKNIKGIVIAMVVIFGVAFTGFILDNIFTSYKVYESHQYGYIVFLILGGIIFSSLAFNDLGSPLKRYTYLTLPASTFEKFLSMWLLTTIGWIVVFTICFISYTFFANTIGSLFFKSVTFIGFSPLSKVSIIGIKYYIAIQGVFLLGAANFKGFAFLKTLFTILLIGVVGGIIFYIFMIDIANSNMECTLEKCNPMQEPSYRLVWHFLQWLFWWVLAPLSWVLTYFGLKDQEA
jgi:hypothetical protein